MPAPSATSPRSRHSCAPPTPPGSLAIPDARLAAEQFVGLVRGETQLRHLLRLEPDAGRPQTRAGVGAAVDTFLRAFARPAAAR